MPQTHACCTCFGVVIILCLIGLISSGPFLVRPLRTLSYIGEHPASSPPLPPGQGGVWGAILDWCTGRDSQINGYLSLPQTVAGARAFPLNSERTPTRQSPDGAARLETCSPGNAPDFLSLQVNVQSTGNAWKYQIRIRSLLHPPGFHWMEIAPGLCWGPVLAMAKQNGTVTLSTNGLKAKVSRSYVLSGKGPDVGAEFYLSLLSKRADCCGGGGCRVRVATERGCFNLLPAHSTPGVSRKILGSLAPSSSQTTVVSAAEDETADPDPEISEIPASGGSTVIRAQTKNRGSLPACMPRSKEHTTCSVTSNSFSSIALRKPNLSSLQGPKSVLDAVSDADQDPDSDEAGADPAQAGYTITLGSVTTTGDMSRGFLRTWNYRVCAVSAGRTGCLAQMTLASCSSSTFTWASPAWKVAASGVDGTTLLWWNPDSSEQNICGNWPGCSSSRLAWFTNQESCPSTCHDISLSAQASTEMDLPLTCTQVPVSFSVAWGWGHVQGCGVAGPCPDCHSGRCVEPAAHKPQPLPAHDSPGAGHRAVPRPSSINKARHKHHNLRR